MLENLNMVAASRGKKNRMLISHREPVQPGLPGLVGSFFSPIKIVVKIGQNWGSDYRLKGVEGAWPSPLQASLLYEYMLQGLAWG